MESKIFLIQLDIGKEKIFDTHFFFFCSPFIKFGPIIFKFWSIILWYSSSKPLDIISFLYAVDLKRIKKRCYLIVICAFNSIIFFMIFYLPCALNDNNFTACSSCLSGWLKALCKIHISLCSSGCCHCGYTGLQFLYFL